MRSRKWVVASVFGLAVLASSAIFQNCAQSSTGSATASSEETIAAAPENFEGVYQGTESGTSSQGNFSRPMSLVINQEGAAISGTFDDGRGNSGTFQGTVSGNKINPFVVVNGESNPCGSGSFTGNASLNGRTITVSVSGTASVCGNTSTNFSVTAVN